MDKQNGRRVTEWISNIGKDCRMDKHHEKRVRSTRRRTESENTHTCRFPQNNTKKYQTGKR